MPAQKGFTLVELMVVVTIIAILTIIGITVFTSVQKNARNARRTADIDAIANAMEANYTSSSGYAALSKDFFSGKKIPVDPQRTKNTCNGRVAAGEGVTAATVCKYCYFETGITSASSSVPCEDATNEVDEGHPVGTDWMVCANLEGSTPDYYCRTNAQ